MAWIEPKWDKGGLKNVNEELALVKGELSDEEAKYWLGQFLMYNLQFLPVYLSLCKILETLYCIH